MDSEESRFGVTSLNEITNTHLTAHDLGITGGLRNPSWGRCVNEIMTRMGGLPPKVGPPRSSLSGCQ